MDKKIIINAFKTIARKEVSRIFRIWKQTLIPPVITQTLYFVIFGGFVGSRIGLIEGIPYMAFIVPGIVMMAVIQNSFGNVVSSFFIAKFQKNIEEILISPTPNWVTLSGYVVGGIVRGSLTGFLVYLVSVIFIRTPITHPFIMLLFLLLTSVLFSLAGFLNALFSKKFDDISIFTTFILVPLTYLGGVFYSVRQLPPLWQNISKFNPILYMVDGFRYGFTGVASIPVLNSILLIIAGIIVLVYINLHLLKKGTGMKQ